MQQPGKICGQTLVVALDEARDAIRHVPSKVREHKGASAVGVTLVAQFHPQFRGVQQRRISDGAVAWRLVHVIDLVEQRCVRAVGQHRLLVQQFK
eukprot:scaffold153720_cov31-Tisochrysis_lutea.AAC.7